MKLRRVHAEQYLEGQTHRYTHKHTAAIAVLRAKTRTLSSLCFDTGCPQLQHGLQKKTWHDVHHNLKGGELRWTEQ